MMRRGAHCLYYTDKQLIRILLNKANELGRNPKQSDIKQISYYKRRFGSWNNSLKAANLSLNKEKKKQLDTELLDALKKIGIELGRTPTKHDFEDYRVVINRFGSWNKALMMIDYKKDDLNRRTNISDEELINELKEVYKKVNRIPTTGDVKNDTIYFTRFGNWENALRLARIIDI